jgi:hypothetical protein
MFAPNTYLQQHCDGVSPADGVLVLLQVSRERSWVTLQPAAAMHAPDS